MGRLRKQRSAHDEGLLEVQMLHSARAALLFATVAALGSYACGGTDTEAPELNGPVAATIALSPLTDSLGALSATAQFTALASDAHGNVLPDAGAQWSSSTLGVATISANGLATAVGNGTTTITAKVGDATATASLRVQQTVAHLAVILSRDLFTAIGDTLRATVRATDARGNQVPAVFPVWQSLDTAVIGVDPQGLLRTAGNGVGRIIASAGGLADTAIVTVGQAIASITVAPDSDTLTALQEHVQLSATLRDSNHIVVVGPSVTWSSLQPSIAQVDAGGMVTALGNGAARIVAARGALADTAAIRVAQLPTSIVLAPQSATLTALGDTLRIGATILDAGGYPITSQTVTWSTPASGAASVDQAGLVIAHANGTSSVTASVAGHAASSLITVAQQTASISLMPALDTLVAIGDTLRAVAVALDRNGHQLSGATFSWQSSVASVASVAQTGTITAVANGTATITAAIGPVKGVTRVVVVVPETIVFSSDQSGNWEIYSIRSDGTNLSQLTNTLLPEQEPVVSLDGSQIAYTVKDHIYLMSSDGSNQRMAFYPGIAAKGASWSPDGKALVAMVRQSGPDYVPFYASTVDGLSYPLPYGSRTHGGLTYSPTEPIVAARDDAVAGIVIFGISRDTSRILATFDDANSPRYDPRGDRIAFVGVMPSRLGNINIMQRDGSAVTRIVSSTNDYSPAWSADGTRLVFVRNGALWIMNVDGTEPRQLTFFATGQVLHPSCRN